MKYYYTDPLAAAWMAKHFGMRFICDGGGGGEFTDHGGYLHSNWGVFTNPKEISDQVYIHSDSLHLLEQKMGDTIESKTIYGDYFTHKNNQEILETRKELYPAAKIILRNGIQFMWPQHD